MRISKFAVGLLISMILLSILLASLTKVLSTEIQSIPDEDPNNTFLKATDSYNNLIWFLQISDLHISIFRDPLRITEFREFCHYTVDTIKPSLVLASGDLTDAKTRDSIGSEQYEDEWRHYRDILNQTHVTKKTMWLDIRGNHDNFNVANQKSKQNFFTNYSVQGKDHPRSYMYQMKNQGVMYSFIGIDACLEPGPRRPFNFVGILDDLEVQEINSLIHKAEQTSTNYTIFFGHFPTSCILTSGPEDIRTLIGKHRQGMAFVCGHLHQLGGIVTKMYTLQQAGFLELELGDWKDNRVYRLAAIDQGLLSFTDVKHRDWPVILITNPKEALLFNPARENINTMRNSTHIRILVFSPAKIEFVKVKIDDGSWVMCKRVKGPLYVVSWNTEEYLHGFHTIEVYVKDIDGRTKLVKQTFSLDGGKNSFNILARIALMTDARTVFRLMFFTTLVMSIVPICLLRYINYMVTEGKIMKPRLQKNCMFIQIKKLWIMSSVDKIFWVFVLYPFYLAIGPWSVGYLVEDHIGVIFAWGIFVNKTFLPGSFTYAYGFVQLFTFQIPLTFIIANVTHYRFQEIVLKTGKDIPLKSKICLHLPFSIIFAMQLVMAYMFWLAYGTLAFILGPLRTWSLILAIVLYYQALNLSEKDVKKAADIWFSRPNPSASQQNVSLTQLEKSN